MWNFDYAIPSLMILAVIIGHYVSLPRLPVKKNLVFVYLIIVAFLGIALDILSTWADINYQLFSPWVLYVLNSGYFIFFFAIAFGFFAFSASVLDSKFLNRRLWVFIVELPINIGILLVITTQWTKWFYYIDDTGYHSGPLYNTLYLVWGAYLVFTYVGIANYKSTILRKRELQILIGYNTILTIGLIFRYAFPRYLLMLIFILIAFIVVFLGFENPDNRLEERAFVFNRTALREYLMELKGIKPIDAFVVCDRTYSEKMELYGAKQTYQGVYLVQNYLHDRFPEYMTFYYGNGRFVLINHRKNDFDWVRVYKELSERFLKPWVSKDTEIYFSFGASIIHLENQEIPFEVIIRVFDEAFTTAQESDEGTVQTIDNTYIERIIKESEIKRSLDRAIENNAVEVFFQPIIESSTGKIAGAEALARIRDSEGKIIPPGLFVPIAEKNGKINKMGKQVFRKCCEYSKHPDIKAMNLSFINVNLSPIQFLRMDLTNTLNKFIDETGADRDYIHLEITEEAMIDEQLINKQIFSLMNSGFKFVLDDYGKGYSNMSRLRKTPFINIKLDMSIVWDYCKSPDHILPSEIDAFKKTGFEVTAEGIENAEMAEAMTKLGCTYLQGFYYSPPLPFDEFIKKYK